jgi:hypothetical protein
MAVVAVRVDAGVELVTQIAMGPSGPLVVAVLAGEAALMCALAQVRGLMETASGAGMGGVIAVAFMMMIV